jgi:organic radical activating enzyme
VLDIGGSIGLAKKACIKSEVKTVFSIDPDRTFIEEFLECNDDIRFNIVEESIERVDLTKFKYDTVFLLLNLPWLTDPKIAIEKVAFNKPNYIVIANQQITPDKQNFIGTDMPEVKKKIKDVFKRYISRGICIDDLMANNGYYPLIVQKFNMLNTVLYTKDKPDKMVYDNAKYIIQINSSCNFDCPWCYVDKLGITMDEGTFHKILETVNEKDMISLRGGEPTLSPNLISGYITPAINKGAYVILESNGSFIGRSQYDDYLNAFSDKDTEIRLSLDRPHLDFLSSYEKRLEHLDKMERFIEDARKYNINFGLYSLGMDMKQISALLEEFSLLSILKYIRPITRYLDIKDLPIKGKFVDIYGNLHDRIAGIKYSEYDKGQSF